MKRSRFTEEQISYALKLVEQAQPVKDVSRQYGLTEATFNVWRKKYAVSGSIEVRELRFLSEKNGCLKNLVADLSLDKHVLTEVVRIKALKPARRRELAFWMHVYFKLSKARTCRMARVSHSTFHHKSKASPQLELRRRLREIVMAGTAIWMRAHIYLVSTCGLDGQCEARAPLVLPGRLAGAYES